MRPLGLRDHLGARAVEKPTLRLRQGDVSDQTDEGDERDRGRAGADGNTNRAPVHDAMRITAPGGRNQRGSREERKQRDRGHLPVPVDRRVRQEGDVGPERRCDERMPAGPNRRDQWHQEERDQQHEADQTALGERLHVEVVRVLDEVGARPMGEPPAAEASRTGAHDRMRLEVVERRPPEHGSPIVREREESAVQI